VAHIQRDRENNKFEETAELEAPLMGVENSVSKSGQRC